MTYFEISTSNGTLGINLYETYAEVSAHRGREVSVEINKTVSYPGKEDVSYPITRIAKKAFLSDKYIHRIDIPETVKSIGDWAFAGCRELEQIYVSRDVVLENGVFKDCVSLNQVFLKGPTPEDMPDGDKAKVDVSFLLAAVINQLEDKYLFDFFRAGTLEWLENWDRRMDMILNEPDDEGFVALLACGEEDYEGRDNTLSAYLSRRRRRKVRICMVRLLHDVNLSEERRKILREYLYRHRAGAMLPEMSGSAGNYTDDGHMGRMHVGRTGQIQDLFADENSKSKDDLTLQDETWKVVLEEHGDEEEYYSLMVDCGCVTRENKELMLNDMGERHARMKAYLLRMGNDDSGDDFFSDLEL